MTLRHLTSFSALALAILLVAGCGESNEDEVVKAGAKPGTTAGTASTEQYKGYADYARAQSEKNRKPAADAGKAAKGADAKSK